MVDAASHQPEYLSKSQAEREQDEHNNSYSAAGGYGEACLDRGRILFHALVGEGFSGFAVSSLLQVCGCAGGRRDSRLQRFYQRVSNRSAIHVYEKFGFVSEGSRPRFYEKPVEDANIMWKRDVNDNNYHSCADAALLK